ncbi:MAG: hypothetical protein HW406_954 [Candidatus Brocadiaceae bacterium]|nr:hypothetical protein [Candidatus Brocadiaceae bacterium]
MVFLLSRKKVNKNGNLAIFPEDFGEIPELLRTIRSQQPGTLLPSLKTHGFASQPHGWFAFFRISKYLVSSMSVRLNF